MRGYVEKEYNIDLKAIKGGPVRMVLPITSGFFQGKGTEADLIPGGGDCPLLDPETNTAHLDVRLSFRTRNGHALFVHYYGVLQLDEKSAGPSSFASNAESTQYGDHEWFASPIIETSDPELKWAERSVFVGEGRWVVDGEKIGIEYEIYRIRPRQLIESDREQTGA